MSRSSTAKLVASLRELALLDSEQLAEVEQTLASEFLEPGALALELRQRGWLTAYQVNELDRGHGHDLVLGSYVLLDQLGEGGMGQVFKARHRLMNRLVALKLIRPDVLENPDAVRRFHREIQAAARLAHPNIITAHDAEQVGERHFLVMEYCDGSTLGQLVRAVGPLPVGQACEYMRQAAEGLQHAHERGLIHRDIKPANLMVMIQEEDSGAGEGHRDSARLRHQVKILDMGLARLKTPDGSAPGAGSLTNSDAVLGTPDFLPPEQARDIRAADIRSDLCSLGCTFYYLLTSRVPFPGGQMIEKLLRQQLEEPAPVEQLCPHVLPPVAAIVRKLMAKAPAARYQTPREAATALAPWASLEHCLLPPVMASSAGLISSQATGGAPTYRPGAATPPVSPASPATPQEPHQLARRGSAGLGRRWLKSRLVLTSGAGLCLLLVVAFLLFLCLGFLPPTSTNVPAGVPAPAATNSDRRAAEYVLSHGGVVHINDQGQEITAAADLPLEPFRLTAVHLRQINQVTDSGLAVFKDCENLTTLNLQGCTHVTDTGLVDLAELDKLTELNLQRVPVTAQGVARLTKTLPKCQITWDGGVIRPAIIGRTTPPLWQLGTSFGPIGDNEVLHVAFSPDGAKLAAACGFRGEGGKPAHGQLHIWDVDSRTALVNPPKESEPVWCVAFAPDSQRVAAATGDWDRDVIGAVKIWELGRLGPPTVFKPHPTGVLAVAFHPNGQLLATGGRDGTAKLLEVADGRERATLRDHSGKVNTVAFSHDGKYLATGSSDQSIKLWHGETGDSLGTLDGLAGSWIGSLAFSADDRVLVAAAGNDQAGYCSLTLWDVPSKKLTRRIQQADAGGQLASLALAPDGRTLATAWTSGHCRIWDLSTEKIVQDLEHGGPALAVAFSPGGQTLATGGGWAVPVKLWRGP